MDFVWCFFFRKLLTNEYQVQSQADYQNIPQKNPASKGGAEDGEILNSSYIANGLQEGYPLYVAGVFFVGQENYAVVIRGERRINATNH